jgi:nicotinate-nucleotide--dimethylbenzimidazole phosphoribosyltransferase
MSDITIPSLSDTAMSAARHRQTRLTKPAGALGRLERLSIQLAGITGQLNPSFTHKRVFVCAGDHGVVAEGVSAFPQAVTHQMVLNFLNGGAAINVLARQMGGTVTVVNCGVATEFTELGTEFINTPVMFGTRNMAQGAAMTREEAEQSIAVGVNAVNQTAERDGLSLVVLGEMGIGNTTAAAAIGCAITGQEPAVMTGRGTGVDDQQFLHKVGVVRRALSVNLPNPTNGLDVLAKVGGLEIGGLVGVTLAAAARRVPVVVDGFIATSAALIAVAIAPEVKPYLIAAHRSHEQGHRLMLAHLGISPLLDLDLRLGEGTGGVLAIPLIEASMRLLNEMATFNDAGVSEREGG